MKIRLSYCFWVLLLSGCGHSYAEHELSRAQRCMANRPDSALLILESMEPSEFSGRDARAQYAVLYAEAADRTGVAAACDSLLLHAREYYRQQPHEVRNFCRTLYYLGRGKLRQGDKPGALRQFLEVEEHLRRIDEPRYLGLLYLRIGDIYRSELNFVRAYRYYREARDLFVCTEDDKHTAEALLGMTASALRMHDLARARRDCSMALELADDAHAEPLVRKSLGYFATLYVVADTIRIPEDLLRRIEQSVLRDTTVSGMCTRARTQLLRNRPAEALRSVEMAARRILRAEDRPMLLYTAYRANMQAGNYREAARQIDRFICLNDSLTRTALQSSAGMIEKEYFRERTAFYDYRLEHRRKRELAVIGAGILLLGIAGYVFRQRIRLHKERSERYLLLVREMRTEYLDLSGRMEQTQRAETRLKGVIASRFEIVDRIGKTLYERENTASGQAAMVRQVRALIDGFSENGEMLQELEQIVNLAHDDVMKKLRRDFPKMKEADMRLLCYVFGGFSPQVISLFLHDSVANVYARKSRLKSRIKASEAEDKELFMSLLE